MILYESKNGKVEWLEKDKIIIKTFSGYIKGDDMRNACQLPLLNHRFRRGL